MPNNASPTTMSPPLARMMGRLETRLRRFELAEPHSPGGTTYAHPRYWNGLQWVTDTIEEHKFHVTDYLGVYRGRGRSGEIPGSRGIARVPTDGNTYELVDLQPMVSWFLAQAYAAAGPGEYVHLKNPTAIQPIGGVLDGWPPQAINVFGQSFTTDDWIICFWMDSVPGWGAMKPASGGFACSCTPVADFTGSDAEVSVTDIVSIHGGIAPAAPLAVSNRFHFRGRAGLSQLEIRWDNTLGLWYLAIARKVSERCSAVLTDDAGPGEGVAVNNIVPIDRGIAPVDDIEDEIIVPMPPDTRAMEGAACTIIYDIRGANDWTIEWVHPMARECQAKLYATLNATDESGYVNYIYPIDYGQSPVAGPPEEWITVVNILNDSDDGGFEGDAGDPVRIRWNEHTKDWEIYDKPCKA